jgi:hypothetical protein
MAQRKYDSTVARIAGNLLSGSWNVNTLSHIGEDGGVVRTFDLEVVKAAVFLAREIVAATIATEPEVPNV